MLDLLQAPAVILGIVGALFVSGYSLESRRFGFALWILFQSYFSPILTADASGYAVV